MDDEFSHSQRLKAAVHFTVGKFCHEIGEDCQKKFSKLVVAAIAETTFKQCDIFAKDLEAFARHAKRTTVTVEDVKLAARRSASLSSHIMAKSEKLTSGSKEHKEKRRQHAMKRKSNEGVTEQEAADSGV
ncbi:centromere protein S [Megalops cyprinoides]|uniref:centromere protein S n=1 Tax=Megalops cyprinoides TaxID=118141 RepID=UPI001863DFA7|nr:centromere protein S [Megalops cyprinoides]